MLDFCLAFSFILIEQAGANYWSLVHITCYTFFNFAFLVNWEGFN